MRNPLLFSSALLIKRATTQLPELSVNQYTPQYSAPKLNDQQIQSLMTNIQSYPVDQQQAILDTINQNFGQAEYRGGLVGGALGGLGNWAGSLWNTGQAGLNRISDTLFGWKPFDTQDSDRYRAQTVLQTAAKNPELYKNVVTGLQGIGVMNKPQPAAKAPATPAPAAAQIPAAQMPAAPAPAPVQPTAPVQNAAPAQPVANKPVQAPVPAPRKEGLIEGIPASQWIAQNKARQQQEVKAYNANKQQVAATKPMQAIAPSVVPQPAAKTSRPLTSAQQRTLNAYKNSPAGRFQYMPASQIRQGLMTYK